MSEELTDKFRADIQISRGRTGKPNPMLLTICANDAEALCDRLAAAESSAAQALREREVLEGALQAIRAVDGCLNLCEPTDEPCWMAYAEMDPVHWCQHCIAYSALASLPTEESA